MAQYGKRLRVLAPDGPVRCEISRAESRMSGYEGIRGSIKGYATTQKPRYACKVNPKVPGQLEPDVGFLADTVNES